MYLFVYLWLVLVLKFSTLLNFIAAPMYPLGFTNVHANERVEECRR